MFYRPCRAAVVAALVAVCGIASAQSFNFDNPVTTGSTQAPGTWYTDRYAPAGFTSPVSFAGDNRLKHTISAADGGTSRPAGYASAFYNTQGRKYDLDSNTVGLSIDLYVDSSWASTERRMAGLWGTAVDGSNAITAYPIIEFTSNTDTDGSGARFRAWDSGSGWVSMGGLPTGFVYDTFHTLSITLAGGMFNFQVGDLSTSVSALGATRLDNVILQGHNTDAGVDYDIYWDNLNGSAAAPVPEPFTLGLAGLGLAAAWRRRRNRR